MKVIEKHKIPNQICKNCKSVVEVTYKDLRWDNYVLKLRKDMWKCPLCKERENVVCFQEINR